MVDIHCHILPDVDDGAETMSDALEMAYLAVSCGVTDLVATSHIRGSREGLEETGLHQRINNGVEAAGITARNRNTLAVFDTFPVSCG